MKAARELAGKAREQLLGGVDPIDAKRAKKAAKKLVDATTLTFKAAAESYHDQHAAKWTNAKHAGQFLGSLREYAFPLIGDMPIAGVTTPVVLGGPPATGRGKQQLSRWPVLERKADDRCPSSRPRRGGHRLGDRERLS